MSTVELAKNHLDRVLPVFVPPKPDMMQSVQDIFDLFAGGFREAKFIEGVKRSFVSTGCVPIDDSDRLNLKFQEYTKNKICGTMKVIPTGTSDVINLVDIDSNEIVLDDSNEHVPVIDFMMQYDNAMFEDDDDSTTAMHFTLNL